MQRFSSHESRVHTLQNEVVAAKEKAQHIGSGGSCSGAHHSNVTRKKSYQDLKTHLNLTHFCHILEINTQNKYALVEPQVTMEALTKSTLQYGLQVPVIPEFKGITVGGAINGAALESSSHKYGLFNDCCLAFHILLANGNVVRATPTEHSDLFYGVAGSYGTLGIIILVEIALVEAPCSIKLTYHSFDNAKKAIQYMKAQVQEKNAPEYIDGIIFSQDSAVIMQAEAVQTQSANISIPRNWFYRHVKEKSEKNRVYEEYLSSLDYFFRYDTGAFWMGAYLVQPALFWRFFREGLFNAKKSNLEPFSEKELAKFRNIRQNNSFLEKIFGKFLSSQRLYAFLHKAEGWIENKCLVQDFSIPVSKAEQFFSIIHEKCDLWPLWICPIKKANAPQLFSPHSTDAIDSHYLNFGVYGLPSRSISPVTLTRELEYEAQRLQGRKFLYSHSYYSQEEFWQIYSRDSYVDMRQKYQAVDSLLSIDQKILTITS